LDRHLRRGVAGGISVKKLTMQKRLFLGMICFSPQKTYRKEQLYGSGKEADADASEGQIARGVFA
jgi:hypothetical protein